MLDEHNDDNQEEKDNGVDLLEINDLEKSNSNDDNWPTPTQFKPPFLI